MRNIQSGIAAVITREKFFNHRVIIGAFIILASAFASYMAMATYVPSLAHAHESEGVDKRDSRSAFVLGGEKSSGNENDSSEAGSEGAGSNSSNGGSNGSSSAGGTSEGEGSGSGDDREASPSSKPDSSRSEVSEIATAPSGASRGWSWGAREYTGSGRESRNDHSRSSAPTSRTSQFNASGCSKRGTTTLRHNGQTASWNNYGEYDQSNSRNECVKSIQRKLNNSCNARLGVDGYYGSATKNAVKNYQKKMRNKGVTVNGSGIHVDGITGVQTFALMQHFSGC